MIICDNLVFQQEVAAAIVAAYNMQIAHLRHHHHHQLSNKILEALTHMTYIISVAGKLTL